MSSKQHITILGGGPAGLAVGYFAQKNQLPFTLFEAGARVGGNCSTLKWGDFLFDTGAHRFHDKDPEITQEIKNLVKNDLVKISAPSRIYCNKKFVDFPLSPLNLMKSLGPGNFLRACCEVMVARFGGKQENTNFKEFALNTYGKTIAETFLFGYSEKLWGASCEALSPEIAGKRMKGLDLKTFLKETFFGIKTKTEHLDGAFYYPKMGYGVIADRLEAYCSSENVHKNSRITRIFHDRERILSIQLNNSQTVPVNWLISTLPITLFLRMMDPPADSEMLKLANTLKYRHIILITVFINKDFITENASLYFPDKECIFTRIYEPKMRSRFMSPEGKTSLVAEIPCGFGDDIWNSPDHILIERVTQKLIEIGLITNGEILGAQVFRLYHAYPVLEKYFREKIERISSYFTCFSNLKMSGRNGKFVYTHLHDMMRFGKEIIDDYLRVR